MADWAIEGAGFAIIIALMTGAFAIAYARWRLVLGICIGMGLALLALPFASYVTARLTNHLATDMDLTPPAYIIATAVLCGGCSLLGVVGGALAEMRRRDNPSRGSLAKPGPEQDGNDDPAQWIPWMDKKEA